MIRTNTLFKVMEMLKNTYGEFYKLNATIESDGTGSASAYVNGIKQNFKVLSNPTRLVEI